MGRSKRASRPNGLIAAGAARSNQLSFDASATWVRSGGADGAVAGSCNASEAFDVAGSYIRISTNFDTEVHAFYVSYNHRDRTITVHGRDATLTSAFGGRLNHLLGSHNFSMN